MTDKVIFDNPWLKVKKSPHGYVFSERKGTDSVAVLLYRKIKNKFSNDGYNVEVLIRFQPLPVENAENISDKLPLFACPITGSIEKGISPVGAMVNEVEEEGGYDISSKNIIYRNHYFVGTQCNEIVYMFLVDVTDLMPEGAKGDGTYHESASYNKWYDLKTVEDFVFVNYSGLIILLQKLKEEINGNK